MHFTHNALLLWVVPLTGDVQAALEHLVHGLGVFVIIREQRGAVAHHGPSSAVLHLENIPFNGCMKGALLSCVFACVFAFIFAFCWIALVLSSVIITLLFKTKHQSACAELSTGL